MSAGAFFFSAGTVPTKAPDKGCWNPQRKMGVATYFFNIISLKSQQISLVVSRVHIANH